MSTKLKIAAAVAAAVLLSACSSPKHEPMAAGEIYTEHGSHRGLSKGLSSAEGFLVPAVYDDMVFAAGGKTLTRLNARTGETEWSVSFNSPITGGVGSDGYVTAVGLWDGNLEVVDAEGQGQLGKETDNGAGFSSRGFSRPSDRPHDGYPSLCF